MNPVYINTFLLERNKENVTIINKFLRSYGVKFDFRHLHISSFNKFL